LPLIVKGKCVRCYFCPVASQPINGPGAPKVSGVPKHVLKLVYVGILCTKLSVPSMYVGLFLRPVTETDIYDCFVLILGQAWLRAPSLNMSKDPQLICGATVSVIFVKLRDCLRVLAVV